MTWFTTVVSFKFVFWFLFWAFFSFFKKPVGGTDLVYESPNTAFDLQVVDIMRVNVDKVLERDQKLSELDDRADALQAGASQFETSAAKLKRKYWWKNCKVTIRLECFSNTNNRYLETYKNLCATQWQNCAPKNALSTKKKKKK